MQPVQASKMTAADHFRRVLATLLAALIMAATMAVTAPVASAAFGKNWDFTCRFGCKVGITARYNPDTHRTLCKIEDSRPKTKPPKKNIKFYLPGRHDAKDCRLAWQRRY